MSKAGNRYPLVIYTHMLNRWYPPILALGFASLALAWAIKSWGFEQWRWLTFASIGALDIFLGLLLLVFRKSAHVRPFNDHFRLVTPFLRLNISYKRIRKASSANMGTLFPRNSVSKWQAEIIAPLGKMTAIVFELNALPMKQSTLRFFLSRFFFKDDTPHLVILVDNWMKFSSEIESMRVGGGDVSGPQKKRDNSILSRLPTNK